MFSLIVNKLFQVNYITRKKIADANHYRLSLHIGSFEVYFALADFELNIKRQKQPYSSKWISL